MKKTTLVLIAALIASGSAFAGQTRSYDVTITNITAGQTFTPALVATHRSDISFFELGQPASDELGALAESGNIMPLKDVLDSAPSLVKDTATNGALLEPGDSVTIRIEGSRHFNRLSIAAMMIPTHDTIVAIDSVYLPRWETTDMATAYDVGTELNDEICANIPGPVCGGEGSSADGGEGYVHVANGIHGIGDLAPEVFDYRNPVAKVTVKRVW
jgi:hypothetical protein